MHSLSRSAADWGVLGIVAVFWSVMPLTGTIRTAFQQTFRVQRRRPFLRDMLFDAGAVFIVRVRHLPALHRHPPPLARGRHL